MPALSLTKRSFTALALAALLAACAAPAGGPATTAGAPARPKLLVFLVVDGLPMRQVTAYREQLQPDGFARFLDRGTWFADAHYGYAFTVTAAGHATMLSGAYPHASGIIGNEWRDLASGETVYCTGDTRYTYIGHKTGKLDGTSPANLKVETVGDVLRGVSPQSKVIGISGKDRGAILPAGHRGTAYMYMSATGSFASSTYYMPAHPAWVDAFNAAKPVDRYFKADWQPALAEAAYAQSLGDNQPWFGTRPGKLPMTMGAALEQPSPAFYASLLRSPFVDEMSLAFARAAIAGERLGQDDAPDILSVSLSGHDYVNHYWSAESRLSHDHFLHLDRLLQAFFRDLDASVGKNNYIAVLTADHGFMPAPEVSRMRGLDAGRLSGSELLGRINAGLEQRFGVAKLGRFFSASALVLDRELLAQKNLDPAAVAEAARAVLAAEPAIAAAYTRAELASGSRAGAPFFDAMRKSWNRERSGDVQYAPKPNWMFTSSSSNTTHGSPHPYDTHVPILMYGPAWLKPARVDRRVETADLAPTLARLLGVAAPAAAEGKLLPLP
ncbi:MAG: alkaline phosphatase family protein [Proteobacteria bacterium]|nr:alkaline phosphatase family protein [Pseudomonadota bacterium]